MLMKLLFAGFVSIVLSLACSSGVSAQEEDTSKTWYEDFSLYAGHSFVKLSRISPGTYTIFGFTGGYQHFKFGFGYGIGTIRGNSGTRYLSAYSHTTPNSAEIAFDSKTSYSQVSLDAMYFLKNTAFRTGSNFYGNLGLVTQIFSMVLSNGQYDPDEHYVADEYLKVSEQNFAIGMALRLAAGYQYTFPSRLSLNSTIGCDLHLADNKSFSPLIFPGTHALTIGISAKYTFVFKPRKKP